MSMPRGNLLAAIGLCGPVRSASQAGSMGGRNHGADARPDRHKRGIGCAEIIEFLNIGFVAVFRPRNAHHRLVGIRLTNSGVYARKHDENADGTGTFH